MTTQRPDDWLTLSIPRVGMTADECLTVIEEVRSTVEWKNLTGIETCDQIRRAIQARQKGLEVE